MRLPKAIVSFTFDDFPASALYEGGHILREHGYRGTYYASFGLMGQEAPTGRIFCKHDLKEFVRQEHELGCHTYHHCHSWNTPSAEFESSVQRNRQAATELLPGVSLQSFSYPISGPRPKTKRLMAGLCSSARGGGQNFNLGIVDLNFLKAFFIEQSLNDFSAIEEIIYSNAREHGWLIFATHDVTASPTRFGCTPAIFRQIVDVVAKSGATVLPVVEALKSVGVAEDAWKAERQRTVSEAQHCAGRSN